MILLGRQTGQTQERVDEHGCNDKDSCIIHNHPNSCIVVRHLCLVFHIYMFF